MARPRIVLELIALPGGLALTAALVDGGDRLLRRTTSIGGDPAGAITGLVAVLAALLTGWLTLCLSLALAAELPGVAGETARRLRDRVTPVVVRRWAAIVLGASVTATVAPGTAVAAVRPLTTDPSPADARSASTAPAPGWASGSAAPAPTSVPSISGPGPGWTPGPATATTRPSPPAPGWVPSRPTPRQHGDPHLLTGRQRAATTDRSVVVRRGDTLWSIAAARLGPEATDAEISRAWPRWHAANSSALGEDPHLLRPGTLLVPPAGD